MKEAIEYLQQLEADRMDLQKLHLNKYVKQALKIAVLEERKRQKALRQKAKSKK